MKRKGNEKYIYIFTGYKASKPRRYSDQNQFRFSKNCVAGNDKYSFEIFLFQWPFKRCMESCVADFSSTVS